MDDSQLFTSLCFLAENSKQTNNSMRNNNHIFSRITVVRRWKFRYSPATGSKASEMLGAKSGDFVIFFVHNLWRNDCRHSLLDKQTDRYILFTILVSVNTYVPHSLGKRYLMIKSGTLPEQGSVSQPLSTASLKLSRTRK